MRPLRSLRPLLPALALLALGAPSAPAAVPGLNLGTSATPGGLIVKADVDDARAAGAKSVRLFVDWHLIETSDDVYESNRLTTLKGVVQHAHATGVRPVLVVFGTPGWANGGRGQYVPPADNGTYAAFVGFLAGQLKGNGAVFEVWNEQDEPHFWAGAPEPARYADMLKRTKAAVDAADPGAEVLFGALTGNNYTFFERAYDEGGLNPGSFDGVAVHTDTACLVRGPDFYVRNVGPGLDGRINRFSFLGFREVRESMLARGADKPIWMTELGWSTYTGPCEVPGVEEGRLGGVTTAEQALFTRRAFECLANYPYVVHAQVFDLRDRGAGRLHQYGIIGKPAYQAFQSVAAAPPPPGMECGDFTAPAITELIPVKEFTGALRLRAKADDASGVTRITLKANGDVIRNFTGADVGNGKVVDIDWQGAKQLPPGEHTIRIEAIDLPSNLGAVEVKVRKLDPATLKATEPAKIALTSLKVRRRKATLVTYVTKTGRLALTGKVQVVWETKRPVRVRGRRVMRWKKVHGGLRSVSIPATGRRGRVVFRQALKYSRYRVKVRYLGHVPYRATQTRWRTVRRR